MNNSLALAVTASFLGLVAVACGGGGDGTATSSSSSSSSIGGTAAVGAPLQNAMVDLRCADGSFSTTTAVDGTWSVSVPSGAAPCLIKASGGSPNVTLFSFAPSAGVANITQFTTLAVGRAAGSADLASYFDNGNLDLTTAVRNTGSDLINALSNAGYTLPNGFDPFGNEFDAQAGDPYDDLLEAFEAALARDNQTFDQFLASYAESEQEPALPPMDEPTTTPTQGGCGAVDVQPRPVGIALLGTCAGTYTIVGTPTDPLSRGMDNAPVSGTVIISSNGNVQIGESVSLLGTDAASIFDRTTQDFDRRVQANYDAQLQDSGPRLDLYIDAAGTIQELRYGRPDGNGFLTTRVTLEEVVEN